MYMMQRAKKVKKKKVEGEVSCCFVVFPAELTRTAGGATGARVPANAMQRNMGSFTALLREVRSKMSTASLLPPTSMNGRSVGFTMEPRGLVDSFSKLNFLLISRALTQSRFTTAVLMASVAAHAMTACV